MRPATPVAALCGAFIWVDATAADLHPIVEVQSGYLFGAIADGKWIKGDEAAKSMTDEITYRVYGLTQALGEAKAGKPKNKDAPCEETLSVTLSSKPGNGVIAVAGTWNALPRKAQVLDPTQKVYVDAVRDFLKTKGIDRPKVKIDNIIRVDLDGDGEEEVLISATNYFSKNETDYAPKVAPFSEVPMRSPAGSYSMVLLRRVVMGKVETQLVQGEFYPKATDYNAPNAYQVIAVLDLGGDGKMEVVVGSRYYEGEATTIYRCDLKKVEALLSVGCGA